MNADPDVDDFQPGQGWALQATASPTPAEWVLPVGATGATANTVTDQSGFANFQWNTATPTDSTVSVTETPQAGFTNDFGATDCAYITPENTTPQPLPDFTTTLNGFSGTVPDDAIATCVIINRLDPEPAIDIEKSTNGVDADAAPGPSVPVGDPIVWTYVVTNTGNVTVDAIAVTDDQLGAVSCPSTSLPATESMTCTMTGVAVAGQYENTATVQGTASTNAPVSDTDVSHYFGAAAGIDIEKATNGLDADVAPGPVLQVGDSVTWTYTVTNTGNVPITRRHRRRRPRRHGDVSARHARGVRVVRVHRDRHRGRGPVREHGNGNGATRAAPTVSDSDCVALLRRATRDHAREDDEQRGCRRRCPGRSSPSVPTSSGGTGSRTPGTSRCGSR